MSDKLRDDNYLSKALQLWARSSLAYNGLKSLMKPSLFDGKWREFVDKVISYQEEHGRLPEWELIDVVTELDIDFPRLSNKLVTDQERVKEFVEVFGAKLRNRLVYETIVDANELYQTGRINESGLVELVDSVTKLTVAEDIGISLTEMDPVQRYEEMNATLDLRPTGYRSLDSIIGGYFNGGFYIFLAGTGVGKSVTLSNLARKATSIGNDVLYITLELSVYNVARRIDAMSTGRSTKELTENPTLVKYEDLKGKLHIKFMPIDTTPNDIDVLVQNYENVMGKVPDLIVIDYFGLMRCNDRRITKMDISTHDKVLSQELIRIAQRRQTQIITAEQLNRESENARRYNNSHVAGGLSKLFGADVVVGIHKTEEMEKDGIFAFEWLKIRDGVKTDPLIMSYDLTCLRLSDMPFDEQKQYVEKHYLDMEVEINTDNNMRRDERIAAKPKRTKVNGVDVAKLKEGTDFDF